MAALKEKNLKSKTHAYTHKDNSTHKNNSIEKTVNRLSFVSTQRILQKHNNHLLLYGHRHEHINTNTNASTNIKNQQQNVSYTQYSCTCIQLQQ